MPSTESLVIAAKSGDTSAYAELVRCYEGTVLITAWGIIGDFHYAQDVSQESFVIAYRKLTQLHDHRTFGAWLLTIVKRQAKRTAQVRQRRNETSIVPETVANRDEWWQEFKDLVPTLQQLPEQERIVVSLRYIDGLPVREIADLTGRPVGTVTKQISRAIARLRELEVEIEP